MSLATQQIGSIPRAAVLGRAAGELLPRDRVTVSAEAREWNQGAGTVPRGDVRWYRPRGDAALQHHAVTLLGWAIADGAAVSARPRRHVAVETYLRTMQMQLAA